MIEKEEKPTLYFVVYVDIANSTPMKAKESLHSLYEHLTKNSDKQDFKERFFIMPVRNTNSRIELLYPTPFLSKEDVEELYQKYQQRYDNIVDYIKKL
jgi:hypothetical protein